MDDTGARLDGSDKGETETSGGNSKCSTNANRDCPKVKSNTIA